MIVAMATSPRNPEPRSPAIVTLDATQMRWQLLRSFERQEQLEDENIMLKRRMQEDLHRSNEDFEKKIRSISSLAMEMPQMVRDLYRDLGCIGEEVRHNIGKVQNDIRYAMELIAKAANANKKLLLTSEEKHQQLVRKYEAALSTIDDNNNTIQSLSLRQNKETDKLNVKIARLKETLGEVDAKNTKLSQENIALKDKYESLYQDKENLAAKYDLSYAEIKRLKLVVSKLEADRAQLELDTTSMLENMRVQCNAVVHEKNIEIESLNAIILDLQLQNDKFTQAMMGNKSNFAKFIELKSENISLQSKLNQVTSKIQNSIAGGIVTTPANVSGITSSVPVSTTVPVSARSGIISPRSARNQSESIDHHHTSGVNVPQLDLAKNSGKNKKIIPTTDTSIESAGIFIGVPMMNKETRKLLKDRVSGQGEKVTV